MNNLSQFHKALAMWDQDHDHMAENYPARLTHLNTGDPGTVGRDRYVKDPRVYQCPRDLSQGKEGGKPPGVPAGGQYPETDEGPDKGSGADKCASSAPWCSYLYEFSGAQCSWFPGELGQKSGANPNQADVDGNGVVTWQETKFFQLTYGDDFLPYYPRTWFPIIRCFWHTKAPTSELYRDVFNLAIDGNFFQSGPKWELVAEENLPANK
jgi:hypothetical protein